MTPVVAECPRHGPFESRAFRITGSKGVSLSGNSEPCPECGARSRVMDGLYDFDAEGIATALLAPTWSRAALRAVQEPLKRAADAFADDRVSEIRARHELELAILAFERYDRRTAKMLWKTLEGRNRSWITRWSTNLLAAIGAIVTLRDAAGYAVQDAAWVGEIIEILQR